MKARPPDMRRLGSTTPPQSPATIAPALVRSALVPPPIPSVAGRSDMESPGWRLLVRAGAAGVQETVERAQAHTEL